jgi:hypothetical protein
VASPQTNDLTSKGSLAESSANDVDQRLGRGRLGHEVGGASAQRLDRQVDCTKAGDQDDEENWPLSV